MLKILVVYTNIIAYTNIFYILNTNSNTPSVRLHDGLKTCGLFLLIYAFRATSYNVKEIV